MLAKHNAINGITATFSESKKTARRLERAFNDRPKSQAKITANEYLRIVYNDPTPDAAIAHIENPTECDHHASIKRRLSLVAA